jgi:cytochrome oxidase Cu insertion factor (SCO1/SenC/PrrC family)
MRYRTLPILFFLSLSLSALLVTATAAPAGYPALRAYGGDFTLTDHNGRRFSLRDARGKVVLLYFGFASCADTCPLTLSDLSAALRKLGPLSERVQTLFISVDPKRDTPEVLRNYMPYFHPSIISLTGTQEEVNEVARQYRAPVYVRKPDESGFYVVDHSANVFVVDAEGMLSNLIRFGTPSDKIVSLVKALLDG